MRNGLPAESSLDKGNSNTFPCWFISQYANWRHADLFFIFLLTRKLYNSLLGSHLPWTEHKQWIYFSQWGLENDLFIDANRSKEKTGRIWREFESFRFLFQTSKTSTGIFRTFRSIFKQNLQNQNATIDIVIDRSAHRKEEPRNNSLCPDLSDLLNEIGLPEDTATGNPFMHSPQKPYEVRYFKKFYISYFSLFRFHFKIHWLQVYPDWKSPVNEFLRPRTGAGMNAQK